MQKKNLEKNEIAKIFILETVLNYQNAHLIR